MSSNSSYICDWIVGPVTLVSELYSSFQRTERSCELYTTRHRTLWVLNHYDVRGHLTSLEPPHLQLGLANTQLRMWYIDTLMLVSR